MARKIRNSQLESRSARLKLPVRRKPYPGPSLARGVALLYRRNRGAGAWVLKASDGHGAYWTKAIAAADDFEESDGKGVLTFFEAQERARKLARGGDGAADSAPITVDGALTDYRRDLEARGAGVANARIPRTHLTAALLAKPVALLTSGELRKWRDGLLSKIAPATINRINNALCAALELAAQHDRRIRNQDAWRMGLTGLPDAQRARNVVLADAKVRELVVAAYARDRGLGLLVDVLATTGSRAGQAVRLLVDDLRDHPLRPKLMMPRSGKGGGRNRSRKKAERYSVPITIQLAARLREAARDRAADAPLLVQSDGTMWPSDPSQSYRGPMREILQEIELDPDEVTMYALRHSSITRLLLANVPIRLVATLHDTSVSQIERNYSRHIAEHGDEFARGALLQHDDAPDSSNVIPIRG
jgi:integrase